MSQLRIFMFFFIITHSIVFTAQINIHKYSDNTLINPNSYPIIRKSLTKYNSKTQRLISPNDKQKINWNQVNSQPLNQKTKKQLNLYSFHTLKSYHPHYLHSYSYPQPSTLHIYFGRVQKNKPIMKIRQGFEDFETNIFIVNQIPNKLTKKQINALPKLPFSQLKIQTVFSIQDSYGQQYVQPSYLKLEKGKYIYTIKLINGTSEKNFIMYLVLNETSLAIQQYAKNDISFFIRNQIGNPKTNYQYSTSTTYKGYNQLNENLNANIFVFQFEFPARLYNKFQVYINEVPEQSQILQKYDKMENKVMQTPESQTCAEASLNKLIKGLSYQYGKLQVIHNNQHILNQPRQLLSFSPSRYRFPWGFLWDDGFHNEVVVRKNKKLTLKIIKSWLDTMINGWIPRQQNRGKQRQQLCNCPKFAAKDDRDGNPPSLILPLYYLIKHQNLKIQQLEQKYWIKLKQWYQWYFRTQMSSEGSYLFRWFDHLKSDIPEMQISYNSGMDDFPRPLNSAYFIDTQAWMYYFAKFMTQASSFFNDTDSHRFSNDLAKIKQNINIFRQAGTNVLKDVGKTRFGTNFHSQHLGYPSLLPLAFGMMQYQSAEYNATMKIIKDKTKLNTGYGLSSITRDSHLYLQNKDSYWRGPVWININYLVLRGLKLYYPQEKFYAQLRRDLINTVCGNWQKTNYFYQNYSEGKGSFSFPFNGWTSLITLIVTEEF